MAADLSLFLFYPLVDLVIRLWKLENFIWVWEMRACRSVGFDMCPVEIVYVFSNGFLIWVVIFLVFVWIGNLDFLRKFWMHKILYFKYFGCWFCSLIIVLSFLGKFSVWLPRKCWDFFFFFPVCLWLDSFGFLHHVAIFQCFFGKRFLIFLGKFRITWKLEML